MHTWYSVISTRQLSPFLDPLVSSWPHCFPLLQISSSLPRDALCYGSDALTMTPLHHFPCLPSLPVTCINCRVRTHVHTHVYERGFLTGEHIYRYILHVYWWSAHQAHPVYSIQKHSIMWLISSSTCILVPRFSQEKISGVDWELNPYMYVYQG